MEGGNASLIRCTDGLVLPCWRPLDDVALLEKCGRGFLYFLLLAFLFVGVSVVSDRFMAAIEVITSQEKEVAVSKTQIVVVRVWNETVANLTLMALGSSAPEILLSVIEIYARDFQAGELGPGTIVGSAAYNLFVIIAICVWVIPEGEVRKIKHLGVFFVTAGWSVFAYVWMYLILCFFSPGEVEIWEGLVTFAFFPCTVLTAYATDRKIHKFISKGYRMNRRGVIVQAEGPDQLEMVNTELLVLDDAHQVAKRDYIATLKDLKQLNPHLDADALELLAHETLLNKGHKSRAFYRMQATRRLMGSGDLMRRISERAQSDLSEVKAQLRSAPPRVYFEPSRYTVLESCGRFDVTVIRCGDDLDAHCSVEWTTEDGTARAGSDYVACAGVLDFRPGETEKRITLEVIDDDEFEPDEHFFVRLRDVAAPPATVTIVDDDHGGSFEFERRDHELVESVGAYDVKVVRRQGARGRVAVPYGTADGTAKAGKEYARAEGELVFENNESEKSISLTIIEEDSYEKDVLFYLQLGEPQMTGDEVASLAAEAERKRADERTVRERMALMGKPRLGEVVRAQIRIKESKEFKNTVDKLVRRANASLLVGTSSWKEQFVEAVTVSSSGDDAAADQKPTFCDYSMHLLTVFWKLLFALIPPTDICNGYLCFVVSISCIGVVTAVIGDVASHFGATLGIKDGVTAIVFVALGTSIPDTFASKVAAIHDKYADASVGNVTGSNAVNVFLGIGVAWSIAAVYHGWRGDKFTVDPGSLAFSVTIFCSEAAVAIGVLLIRRTPSVGGELGGPTLPKLVTSIFLFGLWLLYLTLSTLEAYGVVSGF